MRNSDGVKVQRGGPRGTGGDTGLPPASVYYCGRRMNQCRCGSCDGVCGPNNGCPCNSCLALLQSASSTQSSAQQSIHSQEQSISNRTSTLPDQFSSLTLSDLGNDAVSCIVCMDRPKNATFIHGRTGHTCCCLQCADKIHRKGLPCPICRNSITAVIENFTA